ncbi:SsgA family sporulation/cell division regulator [Streptacidiphilus sp. PB12-B1b]|uniref:SsgA family sporulation/cell division regulator n=1 Tax=Streptacidiphilus sp. PB12-B1b TaxID=2705012 RepID=UPI0015FCC3BE|nr:SsgA family sporulation/cell division regulator [Streptacidiphilus sp. PB12-B1b]QMU75356.1 SsgA family sporulation/cell division regulator [Streptacidiphilus sp. PB12-B1b]
MTDGDEGVRGGVEREVRQELTVSLVLAPDRSVPVPALLVYRAADPYAVHITFHLGQDSPVSWVFARDLLIEGVFRACGHGDVRVWPTRLGGRSVMCLALSSPAGDALIEAPSGVLASWLERSLRLVPAGREEDALDLDGALAALLAGH